MGLAHLGLATAEGTKSIEVRLPGDRNRIREYAVINLLNFLRKELS